MRLTLCLLTILAFALPADARGRRGGVVMPSQPQGFQAVGNETTLIPGTLILAVPTTPGATKDMLDELNEQRRRRGMRPLTLCPALQEAARACAAYRAQRDIRGHTDDFAFVPKGAWSSSAGAACWPPSYGFGGCGRFDANTYAGAATVIGPNGLAYHHIFYR